MGTESVCREGLWCVVLYIHAVVVAKLFTNANMSLCDFLVVELGLCLGSLSGVFV